MTRLQPRMKPRTPDSTRSFEDGSRHGEHVVIYPVLRFLHGFDQYDERAALPVIVPHHDGVTSWRGAVLQGRET
jgi:hypothetical protein